MFKKPLLLLSIVLLLGPVVYAQQSISSTSLEATGPGGSASYVVGQLATESLEGIGGSSAPGVQQPFEIYTLKGFELPGILLEMSAYPNPSQGELNLVIPDFSGQELSYSLEDLSGRRLEFGMINQQHSNLNLSNHTASIYLLKVMSGPSSIKTFKIIKK